MATLGVLELRLTVSPPAGAAPERLSTAVTGAAPVIVRVGGTKATVAKICTAWLAAV